ncbi:MAG: hypothetical protein KF688_05530 [Pirellulales bacterium]|nr:hypothetical protein [Pirellulales bacterium]
MRRRLGAFAVAYAVIALGCPGARAAFELTLSYSPEITDPQRAAIEQGAQTWRDLVLGYQPGITLTGVAVEIAVADLGGPGGTLALASSLVSRLEGGYLLSESGRVAFDLHDIDLVLEDGLLVDLATHEIAHVLGFGTKWASNNLQTPGSEQYLGPAGLNAYRYEFDDAATFVPVELDGGLGMADYHWDESQTVFDLLGRPLSEELMTGYLGTVNYLSVTTIESMRDLGFVVVDRLFTGIAGDVNQDGVLDLSDVSAFQAGWLADTTALHTVARTKRGDLDHSGQTEQADWESLTAAFFEAGLGDLLDGQHPWGSEAPEPDPRWALLLLACWMCRRRA